MLYKKMKLGVLALLGVFVVMAALSWAQDSVVLRVTVRPESFNPRREQAKITYELSGAAKVVVRINGAAFSGGRILRSWNLKGNRGTNETLWDGKDGRGVFVPGGDYVVTVSALQTLAAKPSSKSAKVNVRYD